MLEKVICVLIGLLIIESLTQNYFWPIYDWDALALYDFRALVLQQTGNFNQGEELGYFFQYPPYTSLLHAVSYIFNFEAAKLWYSLIYISIIVTFGVLVRKKASRTVSIASMLIVALSPHFFAHSMIAYTNLSYTAYYLLGTLYLWRWIENSDKRDLMLGGLLVAASLWVRLSEPFWLASCILLIVGGLRKRKHIPLVAICVAAILLTKNIWPVMVERINSTNNYEPVVTQQIAEPETIIESIPITTENPLLSKLLVFIGFYGTLSQITNNSLAEIIRHLHEVNGYIAMFITPLFSYLLIPWILSIIYDWRDKKKLKIYVESGTVLLILAMIWVGTFVFSFIFVTWNQIGESASRMSMFIPPLFLYTIVTSSFWEQTTYLSKFFENKRGNHRH